MTNSLYGIQPNRNAIVRALQAELSSSVDPTNPTINKTFNALLRTATGQKFINWVAAVGEFAQFSIVRAAEEVNLDTAELDSSILVGVRSLGVRLSRRLPAYIDVLLTRPVTTSSLSIPRFTPITGGGRKFYNREPITFSIGQAQEQARLYVGEVFTVVYNGNGADFQTFVPSESDFTVSDGYTITNTTEYYDILVGINGTPIRVVRDGIWNYPNTPAVQDQTLSDGSAYFVFGDGLYGYKPSSGDVVSISYCVTNGSADNEPLFDEQLSFTNYPTIVVTNQTGIQGGANQTPTASFKKVGPNLFAAKERAVTKLDYDAIASTYPGVIDAVILGQRLYAPNDRRYMNVQRVVALKGGDGIDPNDYLLSPAEFQQFDTYLRNRRNDNLTSQRIDPVPSSPAIDLTAICASYVDLSLAEEAIRQAIARLFAYKYGTLRSTIYLSTLSDTALYALQGIKQIKLNTPVEDIVSVPTAPAVNVALSTGTIVAGTYNYAVVALCAVYDGTSLLSERSAPSNRLSTIQLSATGGVLITWDAVPSATQYLVFGRGVGASNMGLLATVNAPNTSYTDNGSAVPNMGDLLSASPLPNTIRFPKLGALTVRAIYEGGR